MNKSFKKLSDILSVSPQLSADDIDKLVDAGIKTVICHRPDEELSADELCHEAIDNLLNPIGISIVYQPIVSISMPEVAYFSQLLDNSKKPLLAYCTTGTRSTILWALAEVHIHNKNKAEVITIAKHSGYAIEQYLS